MIKSKEELQKAKELGVEYFVYRKRTIGEPVVVRIRHYLADEPYEGTIVSVEEFQWQPWGNAKLLIHEATLPELEYVTDENIGDVMKRSGFNWCDVSRDKDLSKYRTFEEPALEAVHNTILMAQRLADIMGRKRGALEAERVNTHKAFDRLIAFISLSKKEANLKEIQREQEFIETFQAYLAEVQRSLRELRYRIVHKTGEWKSFFKMEYGAKVRLVLRPFAVSFRNPVTGLAETDVFLANEVGSEEYKTESMSNWHHMKTFTVNMATSAPFVSPKTYMREYEFRSYENIIYPRQRRVCQDNAGTLHKVPEATKVKDLPYLGVNHRAQLHEDIRKMMDNLMRDQPIIEDKEIIKHTPVTSKLDPSEEITRTKHYNTSVQPINAMQANLSHEEFRGYCLGNIVKYCLRFGRKNGEGVQKEANKIADYAEFLRVHTLGDTIDAKEITSRHREVKQ